MKLREDLLDNFAYCGKHRPYMYLDPQIRAGISLFARVAEPDEIETGCAKLATDIRAGRINEVIRKWHNDGGDYTFTVSLKK